MLRHAAYITVRKPVALQRIRLATLVLLLFTLGACVNRVQPPVVVEPTPPPPPAAPPEIQVLETRTGLASYYHPSLDGGLTASGIAFDNDDMMAAHPSYPLGTVVRVTNLDKAASPVEVRITDRGPTEENVAEGVIIDLSGAAADKLGMMVDGRVQVRVEVLQWGADYRRLDPELVESVGEPSPEPVAVSRE